MEWLVKFDLTEYKALSAVISDYSPLIVSIGRDKGERRVSFRFYNMLGTHSSFEKIVEKG